ncbi:MAG TPA: hypothetical protein VH186_14475 [Chloroflexia bacterium]|nr:hypothetical protein [Chloroflexia bacterium]
MSQESAGRPSGRLRGRGVNYDTGFINKGMSSRPGFDPAIVRRELEIIRDDLHCNAVRLTGGDIHNLETAAGIAAELGLEVWLSPFTCDLNEEEMLALLADCARIGERLRREGAEVVLVTGAEISLLNKGFLPGEDLGERIKLLADLPRLRELIPAVPPAVNRFLARAVEVVRADFGGKVTYASMPFEGVDWTRFDIIGLDSYRTVEFAAQYREAMRAFVAQAGGKPVAITEFGSASYRGAGDRGARAMEIIVWDPEQVKPLGLDGDYIRDEEEQAHYLEELLEIYAEAGIDSAFVFTFVQDQLPYRPEARQDLDMASGALVKVYEDRSGETYRDMRWEPKAAFWTVANFYGQR